MQNKKIIILAMLIVGLLAISNVNAQDNQTADVASLNNTINDVASTIEDVTDDTSENDEILSSQNNELLSTENQSEVLNSPYSDEYSVDIYDTTINYENGGKIYMYISPYSLSYNYNYNYNFYLKIYDWNGNQVLSQKYYSYYSNTQTSYSIYSYSSIFNPGTYTMEIINYADDNLMSSAKLNIVSNYLHIYSEDIDITQNAIINYTLPQGATGVLSVYLDDEFLRNVTVGNKINLGKLNTGYHQVYIVYNGDSEFDVSSDYVDFNVNGLDSEITFEVRDIVWGTPVTINPKVTAGATGKIDIFVNDEYVDTINVGDKYTLRNIGGPYSIVELVYLGDKTYNSCFHRERIDVTRLNSTCSFPETVESGYKSTVTITLNEDANGDIQVSFNGDTYSGEVVNGTYTFNTYYLGAGIKYMQITYKGDSKYNPFTISQYVNVTYKVPTIKLNVNNVLYGKDAKVRPEITEGASGTFKIYIDDEYVDTINVGNSYTLNNPSLGKYKVRVVYSGDSYYQKCENSTVFWTYLFYPIEVRNLQIINGSDKYLKATFYDAYGDLLVNQSVFFEVNDKIYDKKTNGEGVAVLDETFGIGIYNLTIINPIVAEYYKTNLIVFTSVNASDMIRYYNSGYDFCATFLDEDATPLTGTIVAFNVNGVNYPVKTDMNGVGILNVKLNVGDYIVTSINTKTGENTTNSLTIITSINSYNMTRVYNSSLDYKAVFYDLDGQYLKNQTVTFEIGSEKYDVKTDNKGQAILNVCLDAGEYDVISFNPVTNQRSENKLTILARIINNNDVIAYSNKDNYYRVCVIDDNAVACGSGENVEFELNGNVYTIKTDSNGYASLKITEELGIYQVTAKYKGYTVYNTIYVLQYIPSILSLNVNNINYLENEIINITLDEDYQIGFLRINVTGKNGYEQMFRYNARESIVKELTGLNASTYQVTVEYIDNINYYVSSITKSFNVAKINPDIIVVVDNAEYGENSTVTINIPKVSGNVTTKIGNVLTYNDYLVEDGVIIKRISTLRPGEYPVTVTYNGDNNYNKMSKTAILNVSKGSIGFYITANDVDYGSDVNVVVYSSYQGKVSLKINSIIKTIDILANREYNVNFGKLNAGNYVVNGNLTPTNENYVIENDTDSFNVKKVSPGLTVRADNIEKGKNAIITVSVANTATGSVKLELNNKNYTQIVNNGQTIFNISGLGVGKYSPKITYMGDTNYNSASVTKTFEVTRISSFDLNLPSTVSNLDYTYSLDLPKDATGNVTVIINGAEYSSSIINGHASVPIPQLADGDYSYTIKYSGDNKYAPFSYNEVMTITKTTLKSEDMKVTYGNDYEYKTTLLDNSGKPLANTNAEFIVGNTQFTVKTDANGVATFKIGLGNGTYYVTSKNPNTGESKTSKLTIVGGLTAVKITSKDVNVVYGKNANLVITVKDVTGRLLSSAILDVNLNGVSKTVNTDKNGVATYQIDILAPKTYTATISFNGNARFDKSTGSSKIVVSKAKTKLKAPKRTYKVTLKTKKYSVTLKNNLKKPVKKAKITLKINGKILKAKTNKKGVATFKITKITKKGTYLSFVKYGGNKYYKGTSKKVKLIFK